MTTDYRPGARNKDLCLLLQALKETYLVVEEVRCRHSSVIDPLSLTAGVVGDTQYQQIGHKFWANY